MTPWIITRIRGQNRFPSRGLSRPPCAGGDGKKQFEPQRHRGTEAQRHRGTEENQRAVTAVPVQSPIGPPMGDRAPGAMYEPGFGPRISRDVSVPLWFDIVGIAMNHRGTEALAQHSRNQTASSAPPREPNRRRPLATNPQGVEERNFRHAEARRTRRRDPAGPHNRTQRQHEYRHETSGLEKIIARRGEF